MLATMFSRKGKRIADTPEPAVGQLVLADLEKIESLPTLSTNAMRAMAMTNDPNATLADLGALIRRDALLSAAILKLSNSPVYRGKYLTDNVQQAVVRLGFSECARVTTMVGMRKLYSDTNQKVIQACDVLFRHSYFVATLASALNKAIGLGFTGEEFTAALLHDIGRVIICVKASDAFHKVDPLDYEDDRLLERERIHLKTDHQTVGSLFALKNELPKAIGRVILNHHRPLEETEFRPLVALVAAADGLANHTQEHHNVKGFKLSSCDGFKIILARLDAAKRVEFIHSLPQFVVRCVRETRSLCKSVSG
jgi:putative nucleotidyltransferase with HDIG domain